jgi:hypothetical protein
MADMVALFCYWRMDQRWGVVFEEVWKTPAILSVAGT